MNICWITICLYRHIVSLILLITRCFTYWTCFLFHQPTIKTSSMKIVNFKNKNHLYGKALFLLVKCPHSHTNILNIGSGQHLKSFYPSRIWGLFPSPVVVGSLIQLLLTHSKVLIYQYSHLTIFLLWNNTVMKVLSNLCKDSIYYELRSVL